MAQNSLNVICVHFLGILMLETDFWCRLNMLENIIDAGFFVYHCLLFRKLERISSLHVLCSCLNNVLF